MILIGSILVFLETPLFGWNSFYSKGTSPLSMCGLAGTPSNKDPNVSFIERVKNCMVFTYEILLHSLCTFFRRKYLLESFTFKITSRTGFLITFILSLLTVATFVFILFTSLHKLEALKLSVFKNIMAMFSCSFLLHLLQVFILAIPETDASQKSKDFVNFWAFFIRLFECTFCLLLFIIAVLIIISLFCKGNEIPSTNIVGVLIGIILGLMFCTLNFFGLSHLTVLFTIPIVGFYPIF